MKKKLPKPKQIAHLEEATEQLHNDEDKKSKLNN